MCVQPIHPYTLHKLFTTFNILLIARASIGSDNKIVSLFGQENPVSQSQLRELESGITIDMLGGSFNFKQVPQTQSRALAEAALETCRSWSTHLHIHFSLISSFLSDDFSLEKMEYGNALKNFHLHLTGFSRLWHSNDLIENTPSVFSKTV